MGRILKINCDSCRKEWQYAVGSGMYLGTREEILDAFLEKERAEVGRRFDACEFLGYDFHYSLGICSCCKNVVRVPVFRSSSEIDNAVYVGYCPLCGKRIRMPEAGWTDAEENREACPSCGSRALTVKEVGMWD